MLESNIQYEHPLPTGNFTITSELLTNMILSKTGSRNLRPSEIRNAIKINLMTCIKRKRLSGVPAKDIKEGFVYIISNPYFSGFYKIGTSLDVRDRLKAYQTYSPLANYKRECYIACYDAKAVERSLLQHFSYARAKGEWVQVPLELIKAELYKHEIKLFMEVAQHNALNLAF